MNRRSLSAETDEPSLTSAIWSRLMIYLLDTDTCVFILKRRPSHVRERFQSLRRGQIGISAITFCELEFGIAKSQYKEKNQKNVREFVSYLEILDFPASAAEVFGKIRAGLQSAGTPIRSFDMLIAAHALHENLILVTNNTREFSRIPHLQLENWLDL
jgi:tRNA(fMet)-specific endonuclease VapC